MLGHFSEAGAFVGSSRLAEIVNDAGWQLYDITLPYYRAMPYTWKEINKRGPVKIFLQTHQYLFIPKPAREQTLEQACAAVGFLGPSLQLPPLEEQEIAFDKRGMMVHSSPSCKGWGGMTMEKQFSSSYVYLFSRLQFQSHHLIATSPPGLYRPRQPDENFDGSNLRPPKVEVSYSSSIDVFAAHFSILTTADLALGVAISGNKYN